MDDKKVELTISLLNGLLNYLGSRPYGEVANLIQSMQQQVAPQLQAPADDKGE